MTRVIGRGRYAGEVYPQSASAAGGGAGAISPLSRQRFIDGDTTQIGSTGSISEPYPEIDEFMDSRANVSIADATANYVGWLMPALGGYVEDIVFPPYVSTELRADSMSISAGVIVTGNATWANIGGAFAATAAVVSLHNVPVSGSLTVTDDSGAPADNIISISGDETPAGSFASIGSFVSSATTKLSLVLFNNAQCLGNLTAGIGSTNASVGMFSSSVLGDVTAKALTAIDSSFYSSAIGVSDSGCLFKNTTFLSACVLTVPSPGIASFDAPSWLSFVALGGTRPTTVILVTGGASGALVEGAALAAASTNVALNGVGATAGFTGGNSGNHYSTASVTPTTVTLLTAGAVAGDTLLITRTAVVAANLAVVNGGAGAGTIGTIPTGTKGFVLARYNGTNWIFAEGGSLAA